MVLAMARDRPVGSPGAEALSALPTESASVADTVRVGVTGPPYSASPAPPGASFDATGGGRPGTIVKFALETSKNTLPRAATITRACVVLTLGTVMRADPSLGVLAASTVG